MAVQALIPIYALPETAASMRRPLPVQLACTPGLVCAPEYRDQMLVYGKHFSPKADKTSLASSPGEWASAAWQGQGGATKGKFPAHTRLLVLLRAFMKRL